MITPLLTPLDELIFDKVWDIVNNIFGYTHQSIVDLRLILKKLDSITVEFFSVPTDDLERQIEWEVSEILFKEYDMDFDCSDFAAQFVNSLRDTNVLRR